jgi:hypothetical protein
MSLFTVRNLRRRGLAILGVAGIVVSGVGVAPANAAGVVFKDATFSGSAVGSAVHADALTSGTTRVANAEVAIASAAVNTKGLAAATNENGRPVNPTAAGKFSYGRGAGLEVGLVGDPGADGQIILAGKSEGSAPCAAAAGPSCTPPNWHDSQQIGPVPAAPLAWASVAQGTSDAKWNTDTCILGDDISRGLGFSADAQLLDTGSGSAPDLNAPLLTTDATDGRRDVTQTVARETLVPNSKGDFGLRSLVEQTLAPVTLFRGTPNELTIEVLGEWELSVVASGVPGESKVEYRPEKTDKGDPVTPQTDILRIVQPNASPPVTTILDFQTVFGDTGFTLPSNPLIDLAIGEDPRAIGGDDTSKPTISADGTSVSAAVDVVRVRLLDGSLGDIRVGHMEAKASVPAGGITCPIPVTKSANPLVISTASAPDGRSVVTITAKNAFACPLENLSITDELKKKSGDVTFELDGTDSRNDPKPGGGVTFTKNSSTSSTAKYTGLGTLAPGATKIVKLVVHATGGGGEIEDVATAKGDLHCGPASAIGEIKINLSGLAVLNQSVARVLARTGGSAGVALWLGTFAFAAVAVRRYVRTRKLTA